MKKARFLPDIRGLEEHPAARAWLKIGGTPLRSVEVLARRNGKPLNHKSSIYRLTGTNPAGPAVIAKHARQSTMLVERLVYEYILPQLDVTQLEYYGFADEPESGFAWLFLEEATGVKYAEHVALHRKLASEWLGTMHSTTAELELKAELPGLTLERHWATLRRARSAITEDPAATALDTKQKRVLEALVRDCDALENNWSAVEDLWQAMPHCMVHSDFIAKNVLVRSQPVPALSVMDWEYAAWGAPVEDLAGLDVRSYWKHTHKTWTHLTLQAVEQLEVLGRIFRTLAWIDVTALGLTSGWRETALLDLALYQSGLATARREAAWA